MRMTNLCSKWAWLILFLMINVLAAFVMWSTGELIGDVSGFPVFSNDALLLALGLTLSAYFIILGPVFKSFVSVKFKNISYGPFEDKTDIRMGGLIFTLQVSFLFFNYFTGSNIAGSANIRQESIFNYLWIVFPVDALFIIYYGMFRHSKLFLPNAVIWVASNVMRGWSGVFLFIAFLEWCRLARAKKLNLKTIIFSTAFLVLLYPFIYKIKILFRVNGMGGDFPLTDIIIIDDYLLMLERGIEHIVARIQVTSIVVEVIRLQSLLQAEFEAGRFYPFWLEGLHGIAYDRLFGVEKNVPIGIAFTEYGNFSWKFDVGSWNTNVGYVAWFFIAPYLAPFYIIYTLSLAFISVMLIKLLRGGALSYDLVWFTWLIYLLPPWLGAFVNFIYALFLFLIIKYSFSWMRIFRWKISPKT